MPNRRISCGEEKTNCQDTARVHDSSLSLVWRFFYVNFHFQHCLSVVYACLFERYSLIISAQEASGGGTL